MEDQFVIVCPITTHAAEVVVEAVKVHAIQIVDHFVLISVLELPIRSKFL